MEAQSVARSKRAGLLRATLAALVTVLMVAASPALAGTKSGEVVFRLTLEGPAPPTHTFAIRCSGEEVPCRGPETITIVCSPPDQTYDYALCEAKTYELVVGAPVGQLIEYAVLHWTSPDLSHTDDQPEELLTGTWTVVEGRQVILLGYQFGAGTPAAPTLPNTAVPNG